MLITPHAVAGAAIAFMVPNSMLAIPLSLISHFALDTIPHWQETMAPYTPTRATWIRTALDLSFASLLVIGSAIVLKLQTPHFYLCVLSAIIPDGDVLTVLWPKFRKFRLIEVYWNWHSRLQRETSSFLGIIPQLIVILLSLGIMWRKFFF